MTYDQTKSSRYWVNNLVLSKAPADKGPRCTICLSQPRLKVTMTLDGQHLGTCIRGCGTIFLLYGNNKQGYRVGDIYQEQEDQQP